MNKLFRNVNTFGLIVIVLAGILIFTQSAFKSSHPEKFYTSYYFNGASNAALQDPLAWGNSLNKDYMCAGSSITPCEINVPAGQTLSEYLDSHSQQEIVDNAISRRSNK